MDEQLENTATCVFCEDDNTRTCIKCQRLYCMAHRSRISPQLCQDCFTAVTVLIDTFVKTTEEYDEETNTVIRHKSECDRFRLDGPDWVWMSVAINQMNEEELTAYQEVHRHILSLIETVKTRKEVEKIVKLRNENPSGLSVTSETTTKGKTRKVVKQVKTPRDILASSGITPNTPGYDTMLKALEDSLNKP